MLCYVMSYVSLSGETNGEKSQRVQEHHPGQGSLTGESDVDEKVPDGKQDLENKVFFRRRDEDKVLYKYNAIVLPQLYQTELLFRSHDQMGHQGIDKVYQRILKRFEWPGMKKACEKWVTACLSCQQVKDQWKLRFPLQSIESSEFNEVVQIDHQKICMTDSGYNQVLVT